MVCSAEENVGSREEEMVEGWKGENAINWMGLLFLRLGYEVAVMTVDYRTLFEAPDVVIGI